MTLLVEHEFELPKGYVDAAGTLHRHGVMRLATAGDEILTMRDERVQSLSAYLIVVLLARVVIKLGTLEQVTPGVVEQLFAEDLVFLQELYNRLNGLAPRCERVECPRCGATFETAVALLGGS
jgi:hypothetical protein